MSLRLQIVVSKTCDEREDAMEMLVMLGQAAAGLGIFLLGLAAMWFVSVYSSKKE